MALAGTLLAECSDWKRFFCVEFVVAQGTTAWDSKPRLARWRFSKLAWRFGDAMRGALRRVRSFIRRCLGSRIPFAAFVCTLIAARLHILVTLRHPQSSPQQALAHFAFCMGLLYPHGPRVAQTPGVATRELRFSLLSEPKLNGIPDGSIDVVYYTNVLAHLDELERWQYVAESHRVLSAGGRLYIDTIALDSVGAAMLSNNLERRRRRVDSPYMPLPSTGEELTAYFKNAGFISVRVEIRDSLMIVTGIKG